MVPTSIGERVLEYLSTVTPYLIDAEFTRIMESDLDKIANNSTTKKQVLDDFYKVFGSSVAKQVEVANAHKSENGKSRDPKQKAELKPASSKILMEFPEINASIINTKFGPSLLHNNKFHSIMPLLEWLNKPIDKFDLKNAKFILSLPKTLPGSNTMQLALGRYGLYVKDGNKNLRLDKDLWKSAYEGNLSYDDIAKK
jgi:hypothetical protein